MIGPTIAHYSLTIPIPSELAKEVVAKFRECGKAGAAAPALSAGDGTSRRGGPPWPAASAETSLLPG